MNTCTCATCGRPLPVLHVAGDVLCACGRWARSANVESETGKARTASAGQPTENHILDNRAGNGAEVPASASGSGELRTRGRARKNAPGNPGTEVTNGQE